jgi:hypothetical protein
METTREPEAPVGPVEPDEPGYAERDDDELSEQTGGGVEPGEGDEDPAAA